MVRIFVMSSVVFLLSFQTGCKPQAQISNSKAIFSAGDHDKAFAIFPLRRLVPKVPKSKAPTATISQLLAVELVTKPLLGLVECKSDDLSAAEKISKLEIFLSNNKPTFDVDLTAKSKIHYLAVDFYGDLHEVVIKNGSVSKKRSGCDLAANRLVPLAVLDMYFDATAIASSLGSNISPSTAKNLKEQFPTAQAIFLSIRGPVSKKSSPSQMFSFIDEMTTAYGTRMFEHDLSLVEKNLKKLDKLYNPCFDKKIQNELPQVYRWKFEGYREFYPNPDSLDCHYVIGGPNKSYAAVLDSVKSAIEVGYAKIYSEDRRRNVVKNKHDLLWDVITTVRSPNSKDEIVQGVSRKQLTNYFKGQNDRFPFLDHYEAVSADRVRPQPIPPKANRSLGLTYGEQPSYWQQFKGIASDVNRQASAFGNGFVSTYADQWSRHGSRIATTGAFAGAAAGGGIIAAELGAVTTGAIVAGDTVAAQTGLLLGASGIAAPTMGVGMIGAASNDGPRPSSVLDVGTIWSNGFHEIGKNLYNPFDFEGNQ